MPIPYTCFSNCGASFMQIKPNILSFVLINLFAFVLLTGKQANAQSDSSADKTNGVHEVFLDQYEAFKTSRNISGMIAVADKNGYPFPEKVLNWQKQLGLNQRQLTNIILINKELQRKTKEMNGFLITNERVLDSLFRHKRMSNGTLIFFSNRYGLYQGEIRNALLQACLKTETLLSATQIKKYEMLLKD